jgi:protein-disulfide isomerase
LRPTKARLILFAGFAVALAACTAGGQRADDSAPPAAVPEAGGTRPDDGTPAASAGATAGATQAGEAPAEGTAQEPDPTQRAVAEAFVFPRKGPADAALVIYEFADYRCPFCRRFSEETLPRLEEEFMGPGGRVALEFVDFPISDHGVPAVVASEAAHCAGESGRYWDMHNAIFGDFAAMNDLPLEDEAASVAHMVGLAEGIGLDGGAMRSCLETQRFRPTLATLFRDARDANVEVTPTLLVGDEIVLGFLPYEEFRPVVERQLALALGTPVPTVTPRPRSTATP